MPVAAAFDGIKILFYHEEHPPPHFHARYGEHEAMISIETLEVLQGSVPRPQLRKVLGWAASRKRQLELAWLACESDAAPGKIS